MIITGNLTVNTPGATVNNSATVNGTITITDVSNATWNENANGNKLVFNDPNPGSNLMIGAGKTVSSLVLNTNAVLTIPNDATVNGLVINTDATIISPTPVQATIANGKKVTIKESSEDIDGTEVIGDGKSTSINPVTPEDITIANVSSESEFENALLDGKVQTIKLSNSFEVKKPLQINRKVTVDGGKNTITKASDFKSFTTPESVKVNSVVIASATGTEIKDLTIDAKGITGWESLYALQVYNATGVNLDNIALKNGDGGLLVNGSTVTANNISTIVNEFGGIEVSQGSEVTSPAQLTVTGTSTHTSEGVYIWTVGANATVVDSAKQYKSGQDIRVGKEQYTNYIFAADTRPVPFTVLEAPTNGLKELTVSGLLATDVKFLVLGLNQGSAQKIATLDEVDNYIESTYPVAFNSDALKVVDGKISIVGSLISTEDWNKVKTNGNKTIPYQITVLNKDKNGKIAKIAMYQDGKAVIVPQ